MDDNDDEVNIWEKFTQHYLGNHNLKDRRKILKKKMEDNMDEECPSCYHNPCKWITIGDPVIDMVPTIVDDIFIYEPASFRSKCYQTFRSINGMKGLPYCCLQNYRHLFPNKQVEVTDEEWLKRDLEDDEYVEGNGPFWVYETDLFLEM